MSIVARKNPRVKPVDAYPTGLTRLVVQSGAKRSLDTMSEEEIS